jgi:hypothetical protein
VAYGYSLYTSLDGMHWSILCDRSTNTKSGTGTKAISPAKSARYVRVTMTGSTLTGTPASVYEVRVFVDASTPSPGPSPSPSPSPTVTVSAIPSPSTSPSPSPTATESPSPSSSPTPSPSPTDSASPSPTPSPSPSPSPTSPVLLSLGASVTASTSSLVYVPAMATDGDLLTRWCAAGATYPQSLVVDLGATHNLTEFDVVFYSGPPAVAYGYSLSTSLDGTHWNMLANRSTNTKAGTGTKAISPAKTARYVRVTMTRTTLTGTPASVYEVRVFGT